MDRFAAIPLLFMLHQVHTLLQHSLFNNSRQNTPKTIKDIRHFIGNYIQDDRASTSGTSANRSCQSEKKREQSVGFLVSDASVPLVHMASRIHPSNNAIHVQLQKYKLFYLLSYSLFAEYSLYRLNTGDLQQLKMGKLKNNNNNGPAYSRQLPASHKHLPFAHARCKQKEWTKENKWHFRSKDNTKGSRVVTLHVL